ncbi:MAG: hypothetical protein PWQ08_356 [Clostridiales bacterium]|nr:response regulator transcription factor [Pygmaiobacter sp.]MDK2813101.1 hypothetical protein [Clostridiales bacterium]
MPYTVLIVEDQVEISSVVAKYLQNAGYQTICAPDGLTALDLFNRSEVHLLVLDVMMPGIDGFDVLREIRKISDIPVIMLTARVQEDDRLKGFNIGADDYVLKPFSVKELVKRVDALCKRVYHDAQELTYKVGEFTLQTKSMKLYRGSENIPITGAEFALLRAFFRYPGQVLTREQLIELAYGYEYEGYDRSVDSTIKRLRQKLEKDPKTPRVLRTKYGIGYVFGGDIT